MCTICTRACSLTRLPDAVACLSAFASSAASTHSQKISMGSESAVVVVLQSTLHWEHRTLPIFAFLLLLRTGSRAHTLVKAQARGGGRSNARQTPSRKRAVTQRARQRGRAARSARATLSARAARGRGRRCWHSHADADGAVVVAVHAVEITHDFGPRLLGRLLRGLALAHGFPSPPLAHELCRTRKSAFGLASTSSWLHVKLE